MPYFWDGAFSHLSTFAGFAARIPFQKYRILELKIVFGGNRQ
jgi:hypothetical protein